MDTPRIVGALAAAFLVAAGTSMAGTFADHFEDATLRVDFYQYGDADAEHIALDRMFKQGAWAGPMKGLADGQPHGIYVVRLSDPESGRKIFEKGFNSYFGEYRTTGPAGQGIPRVFHETVLLPFPRHPVGISLSARPAHGPERVLMETTVNPATIDISNERPTPGVTVVDGHISGDPHESLDIAFVGEGYTKDEIDVFRTDVKRFAELLLSQEPYLSNKDRINVRGVLLPSADSGVDEPTKGIWRSTSIGASFYSFGSPRYLLTESNRELRGVAANVAYDTLVIMANHDRYGGGGLYNRYCTFTAHGPFAGYLLLHEFGHSFGALADEYYTSSTAYTDFYSRDIEPVEANITALLDPEKLKWADLVTPEAALPTPWDKTAYDQADLEYQAERRVLNAEIGEAARTGASTSDIEALQRAEDRHALDRAAAVDDFMKASGQTGIVGAFEGAGYVSEGLYRPSIDCLMFTRGVKALCPVCQRAVAERIAFYANSCDVLASGQ